jgi:hypothetical protein
LCHRKSRFFTFRPIRGLDDQRAHHHHSNMKTSSTLTHPTTQSGLIRPQCKRGWTDRLWGLTGCPVQYGMYGDQKIILSPQTLLKNVLGTYIWRSSLLLSPLINGSQRISRYLGCSAPNWVERASMNIKLAKPSRRMQLSVSSLGLDRVPRLILAVLCRYGSYRCTSAVYVQTNPESRQLILPGGQGTV